MTNILKYNTMFSFASLQYNHIAVAPFGVQAMKAQGSVRHFASAVLPNDPTKVRFGNIYVYEGEEAVKIRMENPFIAAGLNEDVS